MFDICAHDLSILFWNRLLRLQAWNVREIAQAMRVLGAAAEQDRPAMSYQTGSIPLATAVWLSMLSAHIKPQRIAEVGTFIGKSTAALAFGINEGTIWTCDKDNPEPQHLTAALGRIRSRVEIVPCEAKTSTQMLALIAETIGKDALDLVFYDGRVQSDDVRAFNGGLVHANTVWAFDDFEGTEKGVANVALIRSAGLALITPPAPEILEPFGIIDRSTLALLVPVGLFRFTAQ